MRDWLSNPAWILSFQHLQHGGTLRMTAVFGSAPVSSCQAALRSFSARHLEAAGGSHLSDVFFFLISFLCLWGEIKFPRADAAAPLLNNNVICSSESKETAFVSHLIEVIFLVYILYKRTRLFQATQTCNSFSTFVIYKNDTFSCLCVIVTVWPRTSQKHLLL